MILFNNKLFTEAIGDEVLLSIKAKKILTQYDSPLEKDDLLKLTNIYNVDVAARCYYESLLLSKHGRFKTLIDNYDYGSFKADKNNNIKILVVPGMFYKEHPEVGADGRLIISIAKQCGFKAEILTVLSKGAVKDNVNFINEKLEQEKSARIWFVSLSKGSSEVRHYLQSCNIPDSVKGWLNIAGIHKGSPHVIRKLSSSIRRIVYMILCKIMRVDYQVLKELNPGNQLWTNFQWDNRLDYIHVVPIPLIAHLQAKLVKRHKKLIEFGPNDGIVPVYDVNSLPGKIYPLWGVDHFMRTPKISELLYKFFIHISQTSKL